MANDPTKPRPATPAEVELWERYKKFYQARLTPSVERSKVVAEICADAQILLDRLGIDGFVFDAARLSRIQRTIDDYNKLGRIITAVESGRYFVRR